MNKLNGTGFNRIIKAGYCSAKGFKAAYMYESAFRQEVLLCVFLIPLSFFVAIDIETWFILTFSMLFLLFAEIINSALEALADRISLDQHELIGRAKDMGSAAVSLAFAILFLAWIYAFIRLYLSAS